VIPKKLLDEIRSWINEGRYGHIQINFSGGKIVNYNISQSLKVDIGLSNNQKLKVTATSNHKSENLL